MHLYFYCLFADANPDKRPQNAGSDQDLHSLLRILYNKFILMEISLGINAVIVTKVCCISIYYIKAVSG